MSGPPVNTSYQAGMPPPGANDPGYHGPSTTDFPPPANDPAHMYGAPPPANDPNYAGVYPPPQGYAAPPPGAYPPGGHPPAGTYPPGTYPPGTYPHGTYPPGVYPGGTTFVVIQDPNAAPPPTTSTVIVHKDPSHTSHHHRPGEQDVIPACILFILGWFFCFTWICGAYFVRSKHELARAAGWASLILAILYTILIIILIATA